MSKLKMLCKAHRVELTKRNLNILSTLLNEITEFLTKLFMELG